MAEKDQYRDRAEDILSSLDGMLPASPGPFLYTRLMARMQARREGYWSHVAEFFSRPKVAMALAIAFIMINAYILFSSRGDVDGQQPEEPLMAIAGEYEVHGVSFYETNPEAP